MKIHRLQTKISTRCLTAYNKHLNIKEWHGFVAVLFLNALKVFLSKSIVVIGAKLVRLI